MGLLDLISNITQDIIDKQPKPLNGTVKAYYDGACTVETDDGVMENIECVNIPKIGTSCLLVPVDDEYTCIPTETDDTLMIYSLGLGKFSINDDGDLLLDMAIGAENYFSINNDGDLIIDLNGDTREQNFSINDDGDVIYDGV
jgi:hypothetical protein